MKNPQTTVDTDRVRSTPVAPNRVRDGTGIAAAVYCAAVVAGAVSQAEGQVAMAPRARAGWVLVLMVCPVVLTLLVLPAMPGGRAGAAATTLGLACMWVIASLAVWIARRPPPLPLGLRRPSRLDLLLGLGAGVALMLAVPALSVLGTLLLPARQGDGLAAGAHWSIVLAGVVTAAVTEEVVFRGAGSRRWRRPAHGRGSRPASASCCSCSRTAAGVR